MTPGAKTMVFVDTHVHLDHERFAEDVDQVIERARQAGVLQMVTIGSDMESSRQAIALAERFPSVFATVGIHPHEARTAREADYDQLKEWARHPRVVAIGEIGLDYHYNFSEPEVQKEVFRRQLQVAQEVDLPVVIHSREAHRDVVALLEEAHARGKLQAVLHSFTGSWEEAQYCLETLDVYISTGGMVTFKNAQAIREVMARVPADRLMLETDAPYLSPEPYRGKRNEPSRIPVIAARLAAERGVGVEVLAAQTTANARRFFGLPNI